MDKGREHRSWVSSHETPTKIVACLGSSSTAGKGQAFNWIEELEGRTRNARFSFRNFGVGGDLAYNALERLPEVLACRPDLVIVMVGSNDVLSLASRKLRLFFRISKRLPKAPSPEWFRESLSAITKRVRVEGAAVIALCSLPPIGEDPSTHDPFQKELNTRIQEYGDLIREVAKENGTAYIPVREAILAQMVNSPRRVFSRFRFLSFYRDAFRVLVLHKTLDEVAQSNDWYFHTDGVHLNSRAGMIVADLI